MFTLLYFTLLYIRVSTMLLVSCTLAWSPMRLGLTRPPCVVKSAARHCFAWARRDHGGCAAGSENEKSGRGAHCRQRQLGACFGLPVGLPIGLECGLEARLGPCGAEAEARTAEDAREEPSVSLRV
jgi:hypothetical protein